MKRSATADLPLHGDRVRQWLAQRMTTLGTGLTEAIVHDYGTSGFLSRLSDPFWFQALGAVMGMYWHSSGITTSVMGALKRVGDKEKLDGFRRLTRFVQTVENKLQPEADFVAVIGHEHKISLSLDGRSVFDDEPKRTFYNPRQRSLF